MSGFSLLLTFCGRSVVLGPSIQGVTSLDFDDVPCSQAFDLLLNLIICFLLSVRVMFLFVTAYGSGFDSERKVQMI